MVVELILQPLNLKLFFKIKLLTDTVMNKIIQTIPILFASLLFLLSGVYLKIDDNKKLADILFVIGFIVAIAFVFIFTIIMNSDTITN